MLKNAKSLAVCAAVAIAIFSVALCQAESIMIYRVGDGSATGPGSLVNTGSPVFLDEYSTSGTLLSSHAVPTTNSGANKSLLASGTATSEGMITRSTDGMYIMLTGYNAVMGGTSSLAGTASATVNRVVGRMDAAGNIDTSTALSDFSDGNNPRSVASTNGTDLWVTGGSGGIRYAAFGSGTSTQLSTTVTNLRQANIFDNQLYVSDSSGSAVRIGAVGTGLPTTSGQTIANLAGIPATGTSPYGFFMADLSSAVPGMDTLYVAYDDANALKKYSLAGGVWTLNGTIGVDADDYRGLTGIVDGTNVSLFATRKGGSNAAGGGELVSLLDSSGYGGAFSGTPTLLATAAANEAFRGVALAPVPEPSTIVLLALAALGVAFGGLRRKK